MGLSNYARQGLIASLLAKTSNFGALGSPPTVFVGLSSTLPASDGTNVSEPSTGAYARVSTTSATWGDPTSADPSISTTILVITFPVPTADWLSGVALPYVVFYDASTAGNFLGWGEVANPRFVLNGDPAPSVPLGEGSIELEDE